MPTTQSTKRIFGSRVTWVDGEPGSGKTTFLGNSDEFDTIITFSNGAADNGRARFPQKTWSTIYKLAFPHSKGLFENIPKYRRLTSEFNRNRIANPNDVLLTKFAVTAPGRKPRTRGDVMTEMLHGWRDGPCPVDLEEYRLQLKEEGAPPYVYSLAKWLDEGCPLTNGAKRQPRAGFDEAQDASFLHLRCALGLFDEIVCFGDPGQSLFGPSHGVENDENPPGFQVAHEHRKMDRSFRCGMPLAGIASDILAPFYDRGHSWAASHRTVLRPWENTAVRPDTGLVLSNNRETVVKYFTDWNCNGTWVRAGGGADPQEEMILAVVHEAKGFEADNVYILPLSEPWTVRLVQGDPIVLKVLYVMMTRARKRCFVPRQLMSAIELCLETNQPSHSSA